MNLDQTDGSAPASAEKVTLKFTPGVWETKPLVNAGPTVMAVNHARAMVDQHGKRWPTVLHVCDCNSEADARLIAAAPELYEALLNVNRLISEAALTGFNYRDGDWAARLYLSQQQTSRALGKAYDGWRQRSGDRTPASTDATGA